MWDDSVQLIRQSQGAVENTWPIIVTEVMGKDIHSDTVSIGLGHQNVVPSAWKSPIITWVADNEFSAQLEIGDSYEPALDAYFVWIKVEDTPEVVLLRCHKIVVS